MKKIFNIPNVLSMLRILLVPLFVAAYFSPFKHHYLYAVIILGLSGLSDVLDGIIARRFHMITELGQVLDPIADKLTQGAVVICLSIRYPSFIGLFVLLAAKELCMLLGLIRLIKTGKKPPAAKWWGKMSTVVVFVTMVFTLLFYDCFGHLLQLPQFIMNTLIVVSIICLIFSLFNYYPVFKKIDETAAETKDLPSDETEKP